ncbi:transposase [Streptomyces sp. AA4]|nr:transposase [Streptomyces sp. AA4]
MRSSFEVFLGLGTGKDAHHAVGLDPDGKRLHDGPLPNTERKLRACSTSWPSTVRCWPWSTSRPRSGRCRSRSPAPPATRSPTCPAWRCAASRTSTPAEPKPMPETRSSSPTPLAPLPHTLRQVDVGDEALAELDVPVQPDGAGSASKTRNVHKRNQR